MATWRDGPRYAPRTRPIGFAEPNQAVSLGPDKASCGPAPVLPGPPPSGFQQVAPAVPLAQVAAIPRQTRDPRQPFATVASIMTAPGWTTDPAQPVNPSQPMNQLHPVATTSQSAQRTPYQPFQIAGAGSALADLWAPPPPDQQVETRPASLSECWTAGYPPMLISLLVCALIAPAGPVLPTIYLIGIPWLMASRVHYRVRQVRLAAWIVVGALAALWITSWIVEASFYNVDLGLGWWTSLGCLVLAVADLLLQRQGIRLGEARQQPPGTAQPAGHQRISINQANAATLALLPGIGPVIAQSIVDWRRQYGHFTSLAQLQQIRGIGPNNFARIEPYITL